MVWGRALFKEGGFIILLTFSKLRIQYQFKSRQTLGAKVHCLKGNSPDCWLRSTIKVKW